MTDGTQQRIIQSAGPIFAKKGFERTTVREICTAAESNVASINYHFGDKEALYVEVVRSAYLERLDAVPVPEFPPRFTPEQKLGLFIRMLVRRMLGHDDQSWQALLLMRETIEPTKACSSIIEEFIRPQHSVLVRILQEMMHADTNPILVHQVAFSIIGQCLHYRVAKQFVQLLVETETSQQLYNLDVMADHVTRFSLAAIRNYTGIEPGIWNIPNESQFEMSSDWQEREPVSTQSKHQDSHT